MGHDNFIYELDSSLDLDDALDRIEDQFNPKEGKVSYYEDDHKEINKELPFEELKIMLYNLANGELADFGIFVDILDIKIECMGHTVTISSNEKIDFGDLEVEVLRGSS